MIAPTLPSCRRRPSGDELDVREAMTLLTFPLNAVGAPALALPCGRIDGRAAGLGPALRRPGDDALVLAAGALLEAALRHTAPSNERHEHP